jgi:hypothetical protein
LGLPSVPKLWFGFSRPATYLPHDEEKKRYESHDNGLHNQGYVDFLTPVVETLKPFLKPTDKGLDFGCGPGPILDQLFAGENIKVHNFDPYFFYLPHLLDDTYDFVTCTEVFEHITILFKEIVTIDNMLKPGGYFLVMTQLYSDVSDFATWGYRMDPTHICFLSPKTIDWIAKEWNYELISSTDRIFLFKKKA